MVYPGYKLYRGTNKVGIWVYRCKTVRKHSKTAALPYADVDQREEESKMYEALPRPDWLTNMGIPQ